MPNFNRQGAAELTKHSNTDPGPREITEATSANYNSTSRIPFGRIGRNPVEEFARPLWGVLHGEIVRVEIIFLSGYAHSRAGEDSSMSREEPDPAFTFEAADHLDDLVAGDGIH